LGYRIKTVAALTGVPRNTLLAWERRYNLVEPDRAGNGYREYTDADVTRISQIKAYVDRGYKISEAITLAGQGPQLQVAPPPSAREGTTLQNAQEHVLNALINFDRAEASRIVDQLPMSSFQAQLDELYLPILTELGDGWERGEISIAQEHFASAYCRERMIGMLVALSHGPETGERIVCAGMDGETHEGGLLSVAIRLAARGARVSYLGPDMPVDSLIEACKDRSIAMVCVSATGPRQLHNLQRYARTLRAGLPSEVRVVVGGGAVDRLQPPFEPGVEWHTAVHTLFSASRSEAAR
jgi:DNA-binding transcriptional MerR regulator/methylmalonyl-CoA mutase cobalamin-binding subunit